MAASVRKVKHGKRCKACEAQKQQRQRRIGRAQGVLMGVAVKLIRAW